MVSSLYLNSLFITVDTFAIGEWSSRVACQRQPLQLGSSCSQDLPDEILIECLARVSGRGAYCGLRSVCRKWHNILRDSLLLKIRSELGYLSPVIFFLGRPADQLRGNFSGEILDIASSSSHSFSCDWPGIKEIKVLPVSISSLGSATVGIELFVFGGNLKTHVYSPVLNSWRKGSAMMQPRRDFAHGAIDSNIYVAGGFSAENQRLDSVERYSTLEDAWSSMARMPEARSGCKGEVADGKLFVVGDQATFAPNRAQPAALLIYDPQRNAWRVGRGLPERRWYFSTAVVRGQLCVVGGARVPSQPGLAQPCWAAPLLYHEARNEWQLLPNQRCDSAVCSRLRDCSPRLRVDALGVGDCIFFAVAGDQRLLRLSLADPAALAGRPCTEIWRLGSQRQGSGKFRFRLRYPWQGRSHGIMAAFQM